MSKLFANRFDEYERTKIVDLMKTHKGGWTRASLEKIGVPWPPPKGWRKRFIKTGKATPS